jgi:hypothetical protein
MTRHQRPPPGAGSQRGQDRGCGPGWLADNLMITTRMRPRSASEPRSRSWSLTVPVTRTMPVIPRLPVSPPPPPGADSDPPAGRRAAARARTRRRPGRLPEYYPASEAACHGVR